MRHCISLMCAELERGSMAHMMSSHHHCITTSSYSPQISLELFWGHKHPQLGLSIPKAPVHIHHVTKHYADFHVPTPFGCNVAEWDKENPVIGTRTLHCDRGCMCCTGSKWYSSTQTMSKSPLSQIFHARAFC